MSLIYVAVPTKGVAKDGKLLEHFARHVAQLHTMYPQHTFLVPMIQDYALLPHLKGVEGTWAQWGHHCKTLIEVSDEVWVIMYEGYDTSIGVRAEIELANQLALPVSMLSPRFFEDVVQ